MGTTQKCLRGAVKAASTFSAENEYGLDADRIKPAKLLSKTKSYCTTKSISIATYFVAANAVLTGVATGFATIFAYANYGIWSVMPSAICGLTTIVFWSAS